MEYNLIWQTQEGDQTNFEYEYLTNVIFKNLNIIKHFDNSQLSKVMDNSIIIYSNNQNNPSLEFINYLNEFIKNNYTFYLVHLSNENLGHNTNYYDNAKNVFRNYYDSNIGNKNVIYIPLGFKSGFYNNDYNPNDYKIKKYDFSFVGQLKSDRHELHNLIQNEKSFIHLTNSWNCSTSLTPTQISNIYKETKFVPCPMGWAHPDSFRIMEALEWYSIPIIKKYDNFDYHNLVYGNTPLPKVNSWDEVKNFSTMDDSAYSKLFDEVFSWYQTFREKKYLV